MHTNVGPEMSLTFRVLQDVIEIESRSLLHFTAKMLALGQIPSSSPSSNFIEGVVSLGFPQLTYNQ